MSHKASKDVKSFPGCTRCEPKAAMIVWQCKQAALLVPWHPHVSRQEGGHLIVIPKRHVADRRQLDLSENTAVDLCSFIAADLLSSVFGARWQNYQENGNWGISSGPHAAHHMHLHVYGRTLSATEQPYGEALRFPPKSQAPNWHPAPPTENERNQLIQQSHAVASKYPEYLTKLGIESHI